MRLRRFFPSNILSEGTIEAYLPFELNDSVPLWHVRLAHSTHFQWVSMYVTKFLISPGMMTETEKMWTFSPC